MATEAKIRITADDATGAALRSAQRGLQSLANSARGISSVLGGLGIAVSAVSLTSLATGAIEAAAKLDDLAESTGGTVEGLSALQRVAEVSGTDIEAVAAASVKLTRSLGEIASGGGKDAAAALSALGLSLKELQGLPAEQQMLKVAQALGQFRDETDKTLVALALFGRSGADILPFLKDLGAQSELNARFTAEQAAEAEKLQKAMAGLKVAFNDAAAALANALVPGLRDLLEEMAAASRIAGGFFEGLWLSLSAGSGIVDPGKQIRALRLELEALLQRQGEMESLFLTDPRLDEDIVRIRQKIELLKVLQQQEARRLQGGDTPGERARMGGERGGLPRLNVSGGGADDKDVAKRAREAETRARELAAALRAVQEIEDEARELGAKAVREQGEALDKLRQKYLELIDPLQKYREELDQIDELERQGALNAEQAAEARFKVNEAMDEAVGIGKELVEVTKEQKDIAAEMGAVFTSAFEDAILEGKKFKDIIKGLADDILRLLIRRVILNPIMKIFDEILPKIIPSFDQGTSYVGRDTLAMVHKGEAIIPASMNQPERLAEMLRLPRYDRGTGYVPRDQVALLHRGEAVVPAHANLARGGSAVVINIENRSGTPLTMREQGRTVTADEVVLSIIAEDARRAGPISGVIRGMR